MVDQTKRPFQIPPEFQAYAEKHSLFETYKWLLEKVIVARPNDPIQFMIDLLEKENENIPKIVLLGPPASGKGTLARWISARIGCVHISLKNLTVRAEEPLRSEAEALLKRGAKLPSSLLVRLLRARLERVDCVRKGWILEGLPTNREEALALQEAGIRVQHAIVLEAPDHVLIERSFGKRIDPETGETYHLTFAPPPDDHVASRLKKAEGTDERSMQLAITAFQREMVGLAESFKPILKRVKADQPITHVQDEAFKFICAKERSAAPFVPRIILIGPVGSGKSLQAESLASRYDIVNVDAGQLCREAVANETKLGMSIRSYVRTHALVPDNFVLQLVRDRLSEKDCITRGWVLHGYPRNASQAEQLRTSGIEPNRVFFLHVPPDIIVERLSYRALDPVSGQQFHLVYNQPKSKEVAERIAKRPSDDESRVRQKLREYFMAVNALSDFYSGPLGQQIDADQDPHTVSESIESRLVNRLPNEPSGFHSNSSASQG